MTKAFDRIRAALEDAIAFANGDTSRGTLHTPESLKARRKARHRERAKLEIVPDGRRNGEA